MRKQCVGALLLHGAAVLLGKRSPTDAFYPEVWDVFGGHVEPEETMEQALVRELKEELGVRPTKMAPLAIFEDCSPEKHGDSEYHLYLVTAWEGVPYNRQPQEHTEIGWFPLKKASQLDMAHPGYKNLFKRLKKESSKPNQESPTS